MINQPFKDDHWLMENMSCKMYSIPNAQAIMPQAVSVARNGVMVVSGLIMCDNREHLIKFAEQTPHIYCRVEGTMLAYTYSQPDNGVIEFVISPQEVNCVNFRICDFLWMMNPKRNYLYISDVVNILEMSRWDSYNWLVGLTYIPQENIDSKLRECQYISKIFEVGAYVNPQEESTQFLVCNKATMAFQRMYEPIGAGFGRNFMIYPLHEIIKIYDREE